MKKAAKKRVRSTTPQPAGRMPAATPGPAATARARRKPKIEETRMNLATHDLLTRTNGARFGTVLADPPWRFQNRTGKVAPEHRRLNRYGTMTLDEIMALPVADVLADRAHLYLWVPNALLLEGLKVLEAWGFEYKSNIVWHKVRKDGGPDGRGVGF